VVRDGMMHDQGTRDARERLRADCSACTALCCAVPAFTVSADFAVDKPAGTACRHLTDHHRCSIHHRLRAEGFPGCTVYDCLGAGQHVSRVTLQGRDWRSDAAVMPLALAAYPVVRALHELLWYLAEAADAAQGTPSGPLAGELDAARARIDALVALPAVEVAGVDVEAARRDVDPLLRRASELARAAVPATGTPVTAGRAARGRVPRRRRPGPGADLRRVELRRSDLLRADLSGADLREADLRGADLRGACLIGADLRGADLRRADLIGVDLRGADLRGADLTGCLYLTQPQLASARGDGAARIPWSLRRPPHWLPAE